MPDPSPPDDGTRAISPQSGSGPKPPPAGTDPSVPLRIGRYEVRSLLGEGAFGRVFLAFDAELERQVAIKVPKLEGFTPEMRTRFVREARATATIHHPNVCPVFDVGTEGDLPYIVMHYQAGTTLAAHLDRWKVLPPLNAVALTQKLALGMAAAHEKNVIHRDLKPQNVLFDPTRQLALITDFGLARMGTTSGATVVGAVFGTPLYMSPEQARGDVDAVGPHSDVYSLGVILYRMLTGEVPFTGSVYEVLMQHNEKPPVPPSVARRGLDPRLDRLCLKALEKRPADRYPSAKAFADALGDYVRGGDSSAWQKVDTVAERKPANPVPAPPPAVPPLPPRPLDLSPAKSDRKPPAPPPAGPGSVRRPVSPPRPAPLALDGGHADGGAFRQKVLIGGVVLLFVGMIVALVAILATSKSPPTVQSVEPSPKNPAPKKDDRPAPKKDDPAKNGEPKKAELPSIANGFAGHTFDQAAERRAAEWVLALGGDLKVTPHGGEAKAIKRKDELPAAFTVSKIELKQKPNLPEEEFTANLAGLTGPLEVFFTDCGQVGDETVRVLARVPDLRAMDVWWSTRITDAGLAALAGHPALAELLLQGTSVTKEGIKHVPSLKALRKLTLVVPATDEWLPTLAPLTELTVLNLDARGPPYLSPRGLAHLKPFTKLQHVSMLDRALNDDWLEPFVAAGPFPELLELNLRATSVEGPGVVHLKKLPKLDWIDLSQSRITDAGMAQLAALPKLRWLFLDDTTVSDAGLLALAKCKTLEVFALKGNKRVTDKGMAHLSLCENLKELDLTDTDVGDAGARFLSARKTLKKLVLTGAPVSAKAVQDFKAAVPGCEVVHTPKEPAGKFDAKKLIGKWERPIFPKKDGKELLYWEFFADGTLTISNTAGSIPTATHPFTLEGDKLTCDQPKKGKGTYTVLRLTDDELEVTAPDGTTQFLFKRVRRK